MTEEERDKFVAEEIRAGKCPFGMLKEGQTIGHCPLGFPGCGCADEEMVNPFLREEFQEKMDKAFEAIEKRGESL